MIVYTAVFGDHDTLLPVNDAVAEDARRFYSDVPFVCFTDHSQRTPGWAFVEDKPRQLTNRRSARARKILAHRFLPEADYSIWIDGNIQLLQDPIRLCQVYLAEVDIAVFAHPTRKCGYAEAKACIQLGKDDPGVIREQVSRYRQARYPVGNGLVVTNTIIRRHTEQIGRLEELWWEELVHGSCRDQISFNYACWKLGVKYCTLPGNHVRGDIARWKKHKRYHEKLP